MTRCVVMRLVAILTLVVCADRAHAQQVIAPGAQPAARTQALDPAGGQGTDENLLGYSTAFLALATLGLCFISWKQLRDVRRSLDLANAQLEFANAQRTKYLADQLFEFDKLLIANPGLQLEIEKLRMQDKEFEFRSGEKTALFVQVKAFIYMHLNFFDEIISTYEKRPEERGSIEYEEWCHYIIEKMRHPTYKEIIDAERGIFGKQLIAFVKKHKTKIDESNGTPWVF